MSLSWEQLELMSAAGKSNRARLVLDLAQAIVAGWADKDAWRSKQQSLIKQITEIP